jgi:hypothetical protein
VRELVVHQNYIIFYRVLAESRTVEILRVKHAAQQVPWRYRINANSEMLNHSQNYGKTLWITRLSDCLPVHSLPDQYLGAKSPGSWDELMPDFSFPQDIFASRTSEEVTYSL